MINHNNCSSTILRAVLWGLVSAALPLSGASGLQELQSGPPASTGAVEPAASFDVASVKLVPKVTNIVIPAGGSVSGQFHGFRYTPGRVTCTLPLRSLIREAYSVESWRVTGPGWLDGDYYELAATMPDGTKRAEARLMLQALLKQRFALQTHWEQKILPIYAIIIDKNGFKLKPVPPATHYQFGPTPGRFSATALPFSFFAEAIAGYLDRPAVDMTGIEGSYSFEFNWTPADPSGQARPDLGVVSAIREQLGLRLEPRKAPYPILVVDHAEKVPTAN